MLYTTITRREVLRHIDEKVNEALQRATKFKAMVRNAGLDLAPLSDGLMAQRSAAAFDSYLSKGAALEVPITVDLDHPLTTTLNIAHRSPR